jgi:hypothetical protein
VDHTGCHVDHTGCHVDHTGCRELEVPLTIRPYEGWRHSPVSLPGVGLVTWNILSVVNW